MSNANGWKPGRWWRVEYADGRCYESGPNIGYHEVWSETSDEEEAREHLARCPGGGVLYQLYRREEQEWRRES